MRVEKGKKSLSHYTKGGGGGPKKAIKREESVMEKMRKKAEKP